MQPRNATEETERAVGTMAAQIAATVMTAASFAWSAITYEGLRRLLHGAGASPGRLLALAAEILAPAILCGTLASILPISSGAKRILGLPPLAPPILFFLWALLTRPR